MEPRKDNWFYRKFGADFKAKETTNTETLFMLIYNGLHCIQFAFYANTQACQLVPRQHSIYYCTIMKSDPILTLDHTKWTSKSRCVFLG